MALICFLLSKQLIPCMCASSHRLQDLSFSSCRVKTFPACRLLILCEVSIQKTQACYFGPSGSFSLPVDQSEIRCSVLSGASARRAKHILCLLVGPDTPGCSQLFDGRFCCFVALKILPSAAGTLFVEPQLCQAFFNLLSSYSAQVEEAVMPLRGLFWCFGLVLPGVCLSVCLSCPGIKLGFGRQDCVCCAGFGRTSLDTAGVKALARSPRGTQRRMLF